MAKEYDVMVAGHVCFDLIPKFLDDTSKQLHEILIPGTLVTVGDCKMSTGGPVSNTGIGIQILGHTVCFCARVGDDFLGNMIQEILLKHGNTEAIKKVSGQSSSYTIAISPPNIDRVFLHNPGTNHEFSADDLDSRLIAQSRHFHFGYPPVMRRMYQNEGIELKRVFQIAKEAGAITSCDMCLPDPKSGATWSKILEHILPYIDLHLPSLEETFYMLEPETYLENKNEVRGDDLIYHSDIGDYSRLADKLLAMGTKMVALKAGEKGFYFKTSDAELIKTIGEEESLDSDNWANRELFCPAFVAPQVASATGSGDSSIAGFLAAFIRKLPIETCLKYACLVGWQNVQVLDAISGIKNWEETKRIYEQGVAIHDVKWKSKEWYWNEQYKLWAGPNDPLNESGKGARKINNQ